MRMVDLIEYKKNNGEFNQQQIQFIIDGYVDGSIPDYQMSALFKDLLQKKRQCLLKRWNIVEILLIYLKLKVLK